MNISLTADDVVAAVSILTPIGSGIFAYIFWVNNKVSKSWEAIDLLKERQALVWTREDHENYRKEAAADQKAIVVEIKGDFRDLSNKIDGLRQYFDDTLRKIVGGR